MASYIVITSPSYGGAEKRFFDIFTALLRSGNDIRLIAPSSLVERYRADHSDRPDALKALISVETVPWTPLEFVLKFRELLRTLPKKSSFHYPLNCLWPLHIGRGDRLSMSVVDCTRLPSFLSLKRVNVWDWISFFFAKRVDVLSPNVFDAMRTYRASKRMSLTPGGTFLVPPAWHACEKAPSLVFMGRLVAGKGLDALLDVLPALWGKLQNKVPLDFSVQIAGYGALEGHVKSRVDALRKLGVPIEFLGYADAEPLFAKSSIVLSLQDSTNYPSRVVAEAMMAGCGVIVRDTGDSRQFGTDLEGLLYCHKNLHAEELAEKILFLLDRMSADAGYSSLIRAAALTRFCSKQNIDYFRSVITGQNEEPAS